MKYIVSLMIGITVLVTGVVGCDKIKELCPKVTLFPAAMLPKVFKDGTEVSKVYVEDGFIYREGHTRNKDCRLSRTPVELVEKHLMFRLNGVTESCSGKTCEHCEFRKSGGCKCKNLGQGICAHTITKNTEMLRAE